MMTCWTDWIGLWNASTPSLTCCGTERSARPASQLRNLNTNTPEALATSEPLVLDGESMNRRERRAEKAKARSGVAPQYRLEIPPGSAGGEGTAATAHLALFERYSLKIAASLSKASKKGRSLHDCVAIIICTEGEPDIVDVVPRAIAIQMGRRADHVLGDELARPPGTGLIQLFTFANDASSVQTIQAVPLSSGGTA